MRGRWPGRSLELDGILRDPRIGPDSDHHRGDALDLDARGAEQMVFLLAHELVRQMTVNPVGGRLAYVIADGRIASGRLGWQWRRYTRSCPHRRHIHISVKHSHRGIVRPWNLDRLP